jgi:putative transposase
MDATKTLGQIVGVQPACMAFGFNRSRYYRSLNRATSTDESSSRPRPPLALSEGERDEVLEVLRSERFMDQAPAVVHATLLDEGRHLCSVRTMYRILSQEDEVRERRNQKRHPQYVTPELLATGPNQVWSWDITKLKGPVKWTYFYLYVIMDIFSRMVVGWMVATRETAELAKQLIAESCTKQGIQEEQLTIHSDRGSSMKSKAVALLLSDLGVTKSHSRPYVSNDNPYSESSFKTLKYRPDFPDRFGSIEDARVHCQGFFAWYNGEHRHSGIAMLTPETLHYGESDQIIRARTAVLTAAFEANPQRFKGKCPVPKHPPQEVWINPPKLQAETGMDAKVESS